MYKMPVNPSNKRLRSARSTANDKITIGGKEYGAGAKAGNPNRVGVRLFQFRLFSRTSGSEFCGCTMTQFTNPNRQSGQ